MTRRQEVMWVRRDQALRISGWLATSPIKQANSIRAPLAVQARLSVIFGGVFRAWLVGVYCQILIWDTGTVPKYLLIAYEFQHDLILNNKQDVQIYAKFKKGILIQY